MVDIRKLKELRLRSGKTLMQVSTHLGFSSHQAYLLKENGDRVITADELAKLAALYGVPIAELYTADDGRTEPPVEDTAPAAETV